MAVAFFNVDIRGRLSSVHKCAVVFAVIQFLLGFILMCIAFSLVSDINKAERLFNEAEANGGNQDSLSSAEMANLWAVLAAMKSFALSFAIPLMVVNFIGVVAYGTLSKPGAIVHTVFNSLLVPFGIIAVIFPALEDTIVSLICSDYNAGGWQPVYNDFGGVLCGAISSKFSAITALFTVNIIGSFVAAILGCMGSGKVGAQSLIVAAEYQPVYQPAQGYPQAYPQSYPQGYAQGYAQGYPQGQPAAYQPQAFGSAQPAYYAQPPQSQPNAYSP